MKEEEQVVRHFKDKRFESLSTQSHTSLCYISIVISVISIIAS